MIWTGTDDGVVSVTRDGGKSWNNVTANFAGVPKWTYVSDVVPSQHTDGAAYVTFDGHRGGDYGTYVFATTDFGATTKSIVSNLPKGEVARTIAEDPKNADLLYLGTETGLWVSHNRGGQWTRLKANLPTTPIYEIKIHPRDNDLILATHARGVWILDDPGVIQQWAKAEAARIGKEHSVPVVVLVSGPTGEKFAEDVEALGAKVLRAKLPEYITACDDIYDRVTRQQVMHPNDPSLNESVIGARWRPCGDGRRVFGWKASESNLAPTEASTLALWGAQQDVVLEPSVFFL